MLKYVLACGGAIGVSAYSLYKLSGANQENDELLKQLITVGTKLSSEKELGDENSKKLERLLKDRERIVTSQSLQIQTESNEYIRISEKLLTLEKSNSKNLKILESKLNDLESLREDQRRKHDNAKKEWVGQGEDNPIQILVNENTEKLKRLETQSEELLTRNKLNSEKFLLTLETELEYNKKKFELMEEKVELRDREILRNLRKELISSRSKFRELAKFLKNKEFIEIEKYTNLLSQFEIFLKKHETLKSKKDEHEKLEKKYVDLIQKIEKIETKIENIKNEKNNIEDSETPEKSTELIGNSEISENKVRELEESTNYQILELKRLELKNKEFLEKIRNLENKNKSKISNTTENYGISMINSSINEENLNIQNDENSDSRSISNDENSNHSLSDCKSGNSDLVDFKRKMTAVIKRYKSEVSLRNIEIEKLKEFKS